MKKKTSKRRSGDSKKEGSKLPPWMPDSLKAKSSAGKGPKAKPSRDSGAKKSAGTSRKPKKTGAWNDPFAAREARRYENPIASREAILELLQGADGPQILEEIAQALKLHGEDRVEALSKRLNAMTRDGQLLLNRRGGYAVTKQLDLIAGSVIANPDGFGFFRPDGGGDDSFLPPAQMRKAMHGDRVLASVTGLDARGRSEASIVEVLEHRLTRVMGRFEMRAGIGMVIPDDRRILTEILIPEDARLKATAGQLVICEITAPPEKGRPPIGSILVVLGDSLKASQVVEAAIHAHDLPHEFSPEVVSEAMDTPVEISEEIIAGRVDLRKVPLVTIDGEDAKDFDDAVWCEQDGKGFRLIVAIADVSHYVRIGTALDIEAVNRGTSVYFPGFVVPMLPETLSNGICSLKPKVDRLCFVCDMRISFDGTVTKSKFYEAVMRSHARLTYNQVWKAIGENDAESIEQVGSLMPQIQKLHQLYEVLSKARAQRGAIEFGSSEVRFVLDNTGAVVQAGMLERNDAHRLIEECMIAANVEAGKFISQREIAAPYRVHDRPPESKYAELLEFLAEFQLRLPAWSSVTPKDFARLLKKIHDRVDAPLLETVLLRSQSLAVYSTSNLGHFGLALQEYSHFTSPIRRYPDLLLHRAIKHLLTGAKVDDFHYSPHEMEGLCLQCSEKSRRADEASREVDDRYRSAWMEQHVGAEFDGVISGVTSFGLFVELNESKVNGLVHVTQLPHDYYHFDPARRTMSGERKGLSWRLGDSVRVMVMRASVEERRIDFKLVLSKEENIKADKAAQVAANARFSKKARGPKKAKEPKEPKVNKRKNKPWA